MTICLRCIYDDRVPNITFDTEGICSYCRQVDNLLRMYGTGTELGEKTWKDILSVIKDCGKNKKYDCVVGVSGGTDSSYLLLKCVDWGLRPLAVHYDNTWNSSIASQNISRITSSLGVDLYTHVLANEEADDLYRSFFLACVPEFDASTDMALVQVLRSTAAKFGIRYILEGHSFVTEGLSPLGSSYIDGGYIKDVHRRFGRVRLKTYPSLSFWRFMKWILLYRQRFVRPLWYLNYSKEDAKVELSHRTGWQDYGGHHMENRATAFSHTVNRPIRFGEDLRNLTLAARVRAGTLDRKQALEEYSIPRNPDPQLIKYAMKRMSLSEEEFYAELHGKKRSWREFRNYKKRFEILRPLFYILAKRNLVPMSFYLKYCFPMDRVQ